MAFPWSGCTSLTGALPPGREEEKGGDNKRRDGRRSGSELVHRDE